MKKKIRKVKKSTLQNRADKLFSQYIRSRDQVCQFEGLDGIKCNGILQCMHLMTRRNMRLRYDNSNALAGCSAHHTFYTYHPEQWMLLLHEDFRNLFDYILEHRNEIVKANEEYYRKVIENYEI